MKTFLIAAIAVAVSGAAFAKDLKGSVMNDAEMDKVTAGETPGTTGQGLFTSAEAQGAAFCKLPCLPGNALPPSLVVPGHGTLTAGQ